MHMVIKINKEIYIEYPYAFDQMKLMLQTDKALYLATEYVEPLQIHLAVCGYDGQQKDLYLSWGIFQIMVRQ